MPVPDGLPMRLPPTDEQRHANLVRAGLAGGRSKSLRPIPSGSGVQVQPDDSGIEPGDLPRLGVLYRLDTTGLASSDKVYVPSWTVTEEDFGGSTLTADSAGIGIFAPGVYAVHLFVHGEGMQSAAASCAVVGFCDYTDPFFESFGAVTRGGDPSSGLLFPSTSRTYYQPGTGSGALQPGLAWANLDTVNVTQLELEVQVQQIA